jgi:hypothetical protein
MSQTPSKKHERPSGKDVEFFLSANSQYKKGEKIPLSINGYEYYATVGQRNCLPEELVSLLKNSKSGTTVPELDRYNPDKGGMPRRQEDFFRPKTEVVYQSDFDIEELN